MVSFKIRGNGLRPFNLNWWKPTQKEWAPVLLEDQKPFWRQESEPTSGRPWAALTPKYAMAKLKRYPGQPILRATGAMQDGAKILPEKDGFVVKSAFYGMYHQGGTTKMVARPWMGVPDTSLKHIVPIAWKHILSRKS